jgi:hypothetical protein
MKKIFKMAKKYPKMHTLLGSVRQLYSPLASYIVSQLYDALHRDIVLWTVKWRI